MLLAVTPSEEIALAQEHARKFAIREDLYPFTSHWFERDGCAMHYLDEGEGLPILMLHGNPTWSFLYRDVIQSLRGEFRCIAPDLPGFGQSDHPAGYSYTPREHAQWVAALIDHLQLDRYILMVQDWGGPIGLSVAIEQEDRVAGLVIMNTWAWSPPLNGRVFSLLVGGPVGRYAHLKHNFFARRIVPAGIYYRKRKDAEIFKAYTDPFQTEASRMGTAVFPREIRKSARWLTDIGNRLYRLADKPVEMVWGMKDMAFGSEGIIRRWQKYFPHARVTRLEKASHYLQEDQPDEIAQAARRLAERI